jgi:hypothetical protein
VLDVSAEAKTQSAGAKVLRPIAVFPVHDLEDVPVVAIAGGKS